MIINHNISAMNTHSRLNSASNAQAKNMERLSSGLRINGAADDAAGLSISEKMRGQIRGLETASKNSQDGISMIQTAEGALNETHAILQRMRELAVQASNETNVTEDSTALQNEVDELVKEIGRIKDNTQFNKQALLDGTSAGTDGTVTIQVGANAGEIMDLDFTATGIDLATEHTALSGTIDLSTTAGAQAAITLIDTTIENVSSGRSLLGAYQNRLDHTINNLNNSAENLTAAESRIRDVDMAKEMMEQTKNSILSQAAQAMLAQANQQPQGVLQLLR